MKTIVTGGCGFIGSHLVEKLISCGHEVTVIDDLSTGLAENLNHLTNNKLLKIIIADIAKYDLIKGYFVDVDWVFHLAGKADIVPSIERPYEYFESNVIGTLNILRCVRDCRINKLLYAASSSCYGIPKNFPTSEEERIDVLHPYALTKYMGEELVLHWGRVYKLPVISLRLFNVFGPRSRTSGAYGAVFGVFLAQKLKNKPFTVVGNGEQTRDFTYVTDVVDAFFAAATSEVGNDYFNVGSGGHYSIAYLAKLLQGEVVYIPKRPGEPDCTFADINKINRTFNWFPKVSFEEGVSKILTYIDNWKDAPVWSVESIDVATKVWFKQLKD